MFLFRPFSLFNRDEQDERGSGDDTQAKVYEIKRGDQAGSAGSEGVKRDEPVLAVTEGDEGYSHVQYRSLTYAEVAALRGARLSRIEVPLDEDDEGQQEEEEEEEHEEHKSAASETEQTSYDATKNPDLISEMEYGDKVESMLRRQEHWYNTRKNKYPFVHVLW
ncbi:hypothetical protein TRICI_001220 [Trichomonascus ciferrii]|uniref:Uncharacterized protein n=1 Tax=Trichomonascus ciferrii TaxID=44093 RepID=A0A642VCQ1_9ASCO|nr:hypothetical protein TRICI_001220 [Trichomonascus ciferrii]